MIGRLGSLLMSFRDQFAREATFRWFVVAVLGFIVRLDHHGVSSSVRWLQIRPELYESFLAFFRSTAWKLDRILPHWLGLVAERPALRTRGGALVLIGDGIKVAKEAARMPGVKKLHQESENSGKAPWIFGHHFGVVGILVGGAEKCFCAPVAAEVHEGAQALRELQGKASPVVDGEEKTTIVTLMGALLKHVSCHLATPCVAVLDAYFAVGATFKIANTVRGDDGQRRLHIITRAKSNVVAYGAVPAYRGRGRPRTYGPKFVLGELFASQAQAFETIPLRVYDETKTLSILCVDLLWKPLQDTLRFVLVKDGAQSFILMSSDGTMAPGEIVQLYARRFKIEVTFKTLKHLMGGFCYHFWTSTWSNLDGNALSLDQFNALSHRNKRLITGALNAIEAFVNIALIATGMLQLLALEHAAEIQRRHRWWLRTYSSAVPSEEMIKTVIQHEFYHHFRTFKHTAIYRIIRDKMRKQAPDPMRQAA